MVDAKPETPEPTEPTETPVDEVVVVDEVVEVTAVDVEESAPAAPPPPPPAPPAPPVVVVDEVVEVPDEAPVESLYTAATPPQQVVYVQAPVPPRAAGNRGVGTIFAVLAAIVYGILLSGVTWIIQYATTGATGVPFFAVWDFYVPIIIFAIALIVVVVVVNRAGWGAYVLGSLFVGAAVYFGTIGIYLLFNWIVFKQVDYFDTFAGEAFLIIGAVLAREVAVWFGWIIARRGKKVAARNAAARADFDIKLAEFRAGAY
ncbi:MAG TPA: hypothetical protein VNQ52_02475 [Microbacteriaceae bacterium]|nr:hypothetical protein [Microbacteriaceae bacterium]